MKDFLYFIVTAIVLSVFLYLFFDFELRELSVMVITISIAYGVGRIVRDVFDKKTNQ